MKEEHASLLARIEHFQFDAPNAEPVFVRRLARENGWTIAYAQRASEEYKRFAFLAMASGHPCTPSDQVDQVWHLHLIHTQQYWREFCGEVLGAPLHHAPSRGGVAEAAKFRGWYQRTLESYRAAFGVEPPPDIWPAAHARFATRARRVDQAAFWLVPKPGVRARRSALLSVAGVVTSVALAGCSLIHAIPPFNLRGPEFIGFFSAAWVACMVIAAILRRNARDAPPSASVEALDAYETAYLAGGSDLAAHAAIASLVERGVLELDKTSGRLNAMRNPTRGAHALELELFKECDRHDHGAPPARLRSVVDAHSRRLAEKLEHGALTVPRAQSRRWLQLALLAPAFGAVKIAVGVAYDKPVGILVVLCIASTLIALAVFGKRPVRTTAGDAQLEHLRQRAGVTDAGTPALPALPIAVAVGLFGVGILANTALAELGTVLSSRSGSGGCGGGGCGGGGCGGCGGCGG